MAGTHNFQVFDTASSNMTADADYSTDSARLNGATNGIADPLSFNKAIHQATIFVVALAQYIANQGNTFDDTNLANIITALGKAIISGSGVSFADRIAHGLFSTADIGSLSFCPAQAVPAAATYIVGSAGNLLGNYRYREVLISGYNNIDGTRFVAGLSPATSRTSYDVSPSSQQVSITNLPLGSTGCIGRANYRSAAGGAAGSEKYCGIIWDNTTTTYTDNLIDAQLGTGMPTVLGTAIPANVPTSNTTGTTLTAIPNGTMPASTNVVMSGNTHTLAEAWNGASVDLSVDGNSGKAMTNAQNAGYSYSGISLTTPALRNEYFLNQSSPPSTPGAAGTVVNLYTD